MLTILTPTGTRPEAFALCERMMARQTFAGPVRWIVIDDGEDPTPMGELKAGWERIIIRPEPFWQFGQNTQGRNLLIGLDAAEAEARANGEDLRLTVVEDDDWYSPEWLWWLSSELESAELVGDGHAIYYNVSCRRWKQYSNEGHASLRCTAMRGPALETFRQVLSVPHRYYDIRLWRAHEDKRVFLSGLTVGLKGMPGRSGIAQGHDGLSGNFDRSGAKLYELIGSDAEWYLPFYEENRMTRERFVVTKAFKYPRPDGRMYEPGEEIVFEGRKARRDADILLMAKKISREVVGVSQSVPAVVEKVKDVSKPQIFSSTAPKVPVGKLVTAAPAADAAKEKESSAPPETKAAVHDSQRRPNPKK